MLPPLCYGPSPIAIRIVATGPGSRALHGAGTRHDPQLALTTVSQRSPFYPATLNFRDRALEQQYRAATLPALRRQSRIAIIVGLGLYALSSLLDPWFIHPEQWNTVRIVRWTAMGPAIATFIYTFTPWFRYINSIPLALVGAYAAGGIFFLIGLGDESAAMYYSAAMILVTLFTYSFVGARFIHAITVNLALLVSYNLLFGPPDHPLRLVLGHDFFIFCANVIGAVGCYLGEARSRMLFLREQELDEERRMHLERSLHDRLTGLPNRELLHDRLETALSLAERRQGQGAGIFIDLDAFKPINDTFGHAAGDHVLQTVANRLRQTLRDTDTVARLGGDEFFIVANELTHADDIAVLVEAIGTALAQPVNLPDGQRIEHISASLGICRFPYAGATPGDIIRRADQAMYAIKRDGGSGFAHGDSDLANTALADCPP